MLHSGKHSVEKLSKEFPNLKMRGKEHSETLDNLLKQTFINDPFLSVSKVEKAPVQRFHWLDSFDISQNLDTRGVRPEECDSRISENSTIKNHTQSNLKGNNALGRSFQPSGEKFHSLEAMVAIAQANKDLPGWPLMSNKMMVYKCDKCSQEFWSPMNQRRHMRAKHRRPLNGDKEDLKKKRGQIAAYWDKLPDEVACEIVSPKNLCLMDLTATSIIDALSTQLEKPGSLSLPQSYIRAATSIMDVVQNKFSQFRLDSNKLFGILDDASEKNTFYGVTSSSMQRYIFENEPGKVGLEVKNLVASLGFLIELRLVNAWTDEKEAEALRCLQALVEEEEAAQKKRAKLQERKQQRKMRHKESKDKERKNSKSLSSMEKFDTSSLEDGGSGSSLSSSYSGTDANPMEEKQDAKNFEATNYLANSKEDIHVSCNNEFASTRNFQQELDPRKAIMQQSMGMGWGWKDRKADATHFSANSKQAYIKEKRYSDHHYPGQRLLKKMHNTVDNSFHEFSYPITSKNNYYQELPPGSKKSTNTTGNGHAVWAKKMSQTPGEYDVHHARSDFGSAVNSASESLTDICSDRDKFGVGFSNDPSASVESATPFCNFSGSFGNLPVRKEDEEQQNTDGNIVDAINGRVNGALVIGSVMIPFGNERLNHPSCAELDREFQMCDNSRMDSEQETEDIDSMNPDTLPSMCSPNLAEESLASNISVSDKLISGGESSEMLEIQWQTVGKPGSMTVHQPVIVQQNSCLFHEIAFGTEILVGLNEIAFGREILLEQDSIVSTSQTDPNPKVENGTESFVSSLQTENQERSVADNRDDKELHGKMIVAASESVSSGNMQAASSSLNAGLSMPSFSYLDIANLLRQRWVEATSSSDAVFYHDLNVL